MPAGGEPRNDSFEISFVPWGRDGERLVEKFVAFDLGSRGLGPRGSIGRKLRAGQR